MPVSKTSNPKPAEKRPRAKCPLSGKPNHAMTSVNSSAIRAVDCDPSARQMLIWFHDRGPPTFYRVPESDCRKPSGKRPSDTTQGN
jgi:hypothetical protein